MNGGAGADALDGGDGVDTLDYGAATATVSVDLLGTNAIDGFAADGTGSFDGVKGFENVRTGSGNDVVYASNDANRIETGGGGDQVVAWGGKRHHPRRRRQRHALRHRRR